MKAVLDTFMYLLPSEIQPLPLCPLAEKFDSHIGHHLSLCHRFQLLLCGCPPSHLGSFSSYHMTPLLKFLHGLCCSLLELGKFLFPSLSLLTPPSGDIQFGHLHCPQLPRRFCFAYFSLAAENKPLCVAELLLTKQIFKKKRQKILLFLTLHG